MSASLVGSEMCIRDRGPHSSSFERLKRLRIFRAAISWAQPRRFSKCTDCLLYTSDAADDM
eukprot:8749423-Alexandrium_andersonii.AAC.1